MESDCLCVGKESPFPEMVLKLPQEHSFLITGLSNSKALSPSSHGHVYPIRVHSKKVKLGVLVQAMQAEKLVGILCYPGEVESQTHI